jgi:hypothetical protein
MTYRKWHNPDCDKVGKGGRAVGAEGSSDEPDTPPDDFPDVGQALHSVPGGETDTTGPNGELLAWDRTGESEARGRAASAVGAQKSDEHLSRGK